MRVLLLLVIAAGVANACPQTSYRVRVGSLSPGTHCGEWIATSDASEIDRSIAAIKIREAAPAEFTLTVRVQQLTPDPAGVELAIPGGYIVIRDDKIGLYTSEAAWAEHGFDPLPGHRLAHGMLVRVRGHGDVVEAWVDGALARTWTVTARPVTDIEVAIVGPGGRRARLWFSEQADTPR